MTPQRTSGTTMELTSLYGHSIERTQCKPPYGTGLILPNVEFHILSLYFLNLQREDIASIIMMPEPMVSFIWWFHCMFPVNSVRGVN